MIFQKSGTMTLGEAINRLFFVHKSRHEEFRDRIRQNRGLGTGDSITIELSESELDLLDPSRHAPAIDLYLLPRRHWMHPWGEKKTPTDIASLRIDRQLHGDPLFPKAKKQHEVDAKKVDKHYETVVAPLSENKRSNFDRCFRILRKNIEKLKDYPKKKTPTRKRKPSLKNKRKK
jgi:hypothetical protein